MLKLDIDRIGKKQVRFLLTLQKPYWARAGNKGLNLKKDCSCNHEQNCYDCWIYQIWDDKNRLKLNRQQQEKNLSHNILWDVKKGKPKPDTWHYIETSADADLFLRQFTGFY